MIDLVIIGAGAAGLSCAQTLASAREFAKAPVQKSIVILDSGHSHLHEAIPYQAPGFMPGISGHTILHTLQQAVEQLGGVQTIPGQVLQIGGSLDSGFTISFSTSDSQDTLSTVQAQRVVVATGALPSGISGLQHAPNPMGHKETICWVPNTNQQIAPGLYVAGVAAGEPSMFACAAGSGCRVGMQIYWEWLGKKVILHDGPRARV
jgi:ferredoxin/flavodoxin---NADP+ reductase